MATLYILPVHFILVCYGDEVVNDIDGFVDRKCWGVRWLLSEADFMLERV